MNTRFLPTLLNGIIVYGVLLATPVQAQLPVQPQPPVQPQKLVNLTTTGATIAAGNAVCPDQPFYLYSGGKPDNFSPPPDPAYPSPDLVTFMTTPPSVQGIVDYDEPMNNGRFGDSFNLQNTRSVCYAVIRFRAKHTGDIPHNDGLTIGHVGSGGSPFTVVASVTNPGATSSTQTYALNATGRAKLSEITGVFLDKTPLDSVLDVYLQDDTMIDFFSLWVWYGPNCSEVSPPTC
jgi:hypothetical protein